MQNGYESQCNVKLHQKPRASILHMYKKWFEERDLHTVAHTKDAQLQIGQNFRRKTLYESELEKPD